MTMLPLWWPQSEAELSEGVANRSGTPLAVRLGGPLITSLADELREALRETSWHFLVGGWTDPILASLPASSRELQITREIEELTALGLTSLIGFVPFGWESELATLFSNHGISQVAVGASTALAEPVITDRLGDVVTVLPLLNSPPSVVVVVRHPARSHPPTDRSWAEELNHNPEAALLYRKMLRLANRLPERPPAEAAELLMDAQAAHWYTGEIDRSGAHAALINARRRIDQERRVPPDWTKVTQLDWDADGTIEAHLENRDVSMVVDPGEGFIKTVDLKAEGHPLSYIPGEPPWRIARVLSDGKPVRLSLELEAVEESRDQITVRMTREGLTVALVVKNTELTFDFITGEAFDYQRIGPEMGLALNRSVRMRVDGGSWTTIDEPAAHPGHRFRFDDGRRQVLISLVQPGDLFVTRTAGGVIAWANWPVRAGEFRMIVSLTG
ncbi:MAG TPA: hypothetical protein VM470_05640 [Acidimicrobiia bacterium]|nr:hypothetical protein [Acidimicrobiia bacterium]